ncbi:NERD domain-containing protein [Roseiconus nitratireducens]|uniref:NERD domain-containing protein n=1 Tax=Roseiconus nitratireducens TaxID=2605748 RepID=A0A5M6DJD1_9BACT|nr:nuclease-related domain-containing protein [Roseiconus nitratireducens]KAA5545395.1 NERD domain-containing protein [Roseiconus nitratireducens]
MELVGVTMILNEKVGPVPSDRRLRAGYEAEKQMAFYLRRAFGELPDVFVFNDLRVVRGGEVAQIDHLVLHPFGFALVESKSVTGTIEVNEHQEFTRVYGRTRMGMKSPVVQVKMQAKLLRSLLNDRKEELRRKVLLGMVQGQFGEQRFATFVAVSDGGEIKRKGVAAPEVVKADQVAQRIENLISEIHLVTGVRGFLRYAATSDEAKQAAMIENKVAPFTTEELQAIREFLLRSHEPFVQPPPVVRETRDASHPPLPPPALSNQRSAPRSASGDASAKRTSCRHCGQALEILYGRYGYYFKCQGCQRNERINLTCPCGVRAKIRKRGPRFRWDCKACGNTSHFYTNPQSAPSDGSSL